MKSEQTLKLVPVKKPTVRNAILERRDKLIRNINKQIEAVRQFQQGKKPERAWFWTDDQGNTFVQIKYGKIVLELSKGKFAIQCSSVDDIEANLSIVKSMVMQGEMDEILEISKPVRSNSSPSLICSCFQVTESQIRTAIDEGGAETVDQVTEMTGAGGGCGGCRCRVKRLLAGFPAECGPCSLCPGCGYIKLLCDCQAA